MVFVALALWLALTLLLALPVSVVLRRHDVLDEPEPIDHVELGEAMDRHPSRRSSAA